MLRRHGITVIELAVTLAILAILTVLVVPNLGGWLRHYQMRGTVREIVSQMELAKVRALKTNWHYQVAFEPAVRAFRIERRLYPSDAWRPESDDFHIPHQVEFGVNVPGIAFHPDGTATSGRVVIGPAEGKHYEITVNSTTGKVHTIREN
jgi:hypothetical protein